MKFSNGATLGCIPSTLTAAKVKAHKLVIVSTSVEVN